MNLGKKKISDWISCLVMLLGGIVYFLITISVLNNGLSYNYFPILLLLIIVIFLFFKKKEKVMLFVKKKKTVVKIAMVVLIILGFTLRFSFLFIQDHFLIDETLSDTGVHWYGSQQIFNDGQFDAEVGKYERIYPYLSAYTGALSVSKMIFGDNYCAIVFLNVFFDMISCLGIYLLFYFWKRRREVALFAATVWMINPLQIVFCGLPLAIVVVNTFVILGVLLVYLLFRYKNNTALLCVNSLICGLIFSLGNAFRPIFIVFLLATIVYWVMIALKEKRRETYLKFAISSLFLVIGYVVVGVLATAMHVQINPYYHGEKARAGWGIYVGANYETKGRWSRADSSEFFGPILEEQSDGDVEKAQSIVLDVAIERYISIASNINLMQHFANKISVVFGDVNNSIYDFPKVFHFSKENRMYKIIQDLILVFYHIILLVIGYYIYKMIKTKEYLQGNNYMSYLIVLIVGLFVAFLLVEAMNRYCLPFITILVVIALGLVFREKKDVGML